MAIRMANQAMPNRATNAAAYGRLLKTRTRTQPWARIGAAIDGRRLTACRNDVMDTGVLLRRGVRTRKGEPVTRFAFLCVLWGVMRWRARRGGRGSRGCSGGLARSPGR